MGLPTAWHRPRQSAAPRLLLTSDGLPERVPFLHSAPRELLRRTLALALGG